ncbi:glycoside hydrolase family 3 C-terminal domain-containing protein [Marinoscillum sp. 108]|uniref:glycoside hydrolase family 3 C-terminal domain-containing protein n=1 Tax=Marinoscillum sp. 108 TaxID=2653151 RepID=UPI0012EEF3BE|nr:glycoside hydrolase family 3 C-terminal domain-containing protein [Marinoscillum sp. 108]VXD14108.1 Glucan 1,4-alpha-glucosidase [Marinoscillum sp. 108]
MFFNRPTNTLYLLSLLLIGMGCQPHASYEFPFQNPELTLETRVDDLVSRMTLEEKVSQMVNEAPAIEHLGIPEYNWWNEGLHGVARAGLATVFPQAIGLGATWDERHMLKVATAISDEARAKHHNFVSRGKRNLYQGLTLWSPNINIFRDPRWGRGQETYGEDPYLTGKMAVQFVRGLQGDDPTYLKTVATVKHFAVHNGPEPERHVFNAQSNYRDLWETYLPQFEMAIRQGKAYSAMCAYNRYNDEACCGSSTLMTDILRNEIGFDGYIVSDCGAIEDIFKHHQLVATPEEAAALAVKTGCDLNCGLGEAIFPYLVQAVEKGLIDENTIDTSVKRLFMARFKLGMFDPEENVPFAQIPYSVVDSKVHQALADETARKSMVLLKNEQQTLPLSKDLKKVAVIGPNANQWLMLLGNYNGVPSAPVTPWAGIQQKLPNASVTFAQGCELAEGMPMFYTIPGENLNSLKASFYNNRTLQGDPLYSESWDMLDANWNDRAPREDMDDDNFGVRWEGQLSPSVSGFYQLGFIGTMNTQLYLNDSLVAKTSYHFRDEYGDPRLRKSDQIWLEAEQSYDLKLEAGDSYADATVQLVWAAPKPNLKAEALKAAQYAEVVILCMGLTPRMEGEEMDIQIEGFRGGDRTTLELPQTQKDLIRSIEKLGKPTVLILLNGSALAINWENENIPAILEAWYPGQSAGTAIADILFGDYNPAGRLPVTFYKSADDLPPFEDYNMAGHTYRYFQGDPLYPFGYGLSYTSFEYGDLTVSEGNTTDQAVSVLVKVTNTGKVAGEEVVQVYLSNLSTQLPTPAHSLQGFERVSLEPGESKFIRFVLPPAAFRVIDDQNQKVVLPGEYQLSVGGGQPGVTLQTSNILSKTINLQ